MSDATVNCPHCRQQMIAPPDSLHNTPDCPSCGQQITTLASEPTHPVSAKPAPEETALSQQPPRFVWLIAGTSVLLFVLGLWFVYSTFGGDILLAVLLVLGLFAWIGDWVETLQKKGVSVRAAVLRLTAEVLITGAGGGLAFLVWHHLGYAAYRLPDFARVGAEEPSLIIVFASGASTGLLLGFLPALRKKE